MLRHWRSRQHEVRIREVGAVFEIFAVRSLSAALFLPLLVATACCFAFWKESSAIKLVGTYIQRGDPSSVDAKYYRKSRSITAL
jgi:hypothetical protein